MRLVSFSTEDGPAAGVQIGEELVPVSALDAPARTVRGLLEALDADGLRELGRRAGEASERIALADVALHAPVTDPQKIVCLGLNYRDHAEETGQEIPTAPMWFAKFANSLHRQRRRDRAPGRPPGARRLRGRARARDRAPARRTSAPRSALSYIAGAMPFNDVSARDLQMQNPLWTSGKAIDTFAPCGPALVTLDEIDDLGALGLRTRVNGEVLQEGTTANLIFGPAEVVAWLSRTMTLLPGDIIATGTPAGVGAAQGRFLRDGDTVEVEVDGLGTLVNAVRGES